MDAAKVQALLVYLKNYGEATTAYNDLRPFAERLDVEDRVQLVRIITGNSSFGDSGRLRNGSIQFSGKLCPAQEDVGTPLSLLFPLITVPESFMVEYDLIRLLTRIVYNRQHDYCTDKQI